MGRRLWGTRPRLQANMAGDSRERLANAEKANHRGKEGNQNVAAVNLVVANKLRAIPKRQAVGGARGRGVGQCGWEEGKEEG